MFRSLLGKIQTNKERLEEIKELVFRSLLGKIQTRAEAMFALTADPGFDPS